MQLYRRIIALYWHLYRVLDLCTPELDRVCKCLEKCWSLYHQILELIKLYGVEIEHSALVLVIALTFLMWLDFYVFVSPVVFFSGFSLVYLTCLALTPPQFFFYFCPFGSQTTRLSQHPFFWVALWSTLYYAFFLPR